MSANREHCKEQIERFRHYPGYPDTLAGLRDLVDTLARVSVSDDHAKATVEALLLDADFCPKVKHIADVANGLVDRSETRRKTSGCQICGGTGVQVIEHWRHEKQTVRQPDGTEQEQLVWLSAAGPCPRCGVATRPEAA